MACRVALFEKAKELSAGRVERALLIFGPVGDERSTFVVEDREHDLVCRPLSEPRVLMRNLTVAYRDGAKQLTAFCLKFSPPLENLWAILVVLA